MRRHFNTTSVFIIPVILFSFACGCNPANNNAAGSISSDPKIAALKLPTDFHADHLYSPGIHDQGSWVAMTFDDKGRMIASDQYGNLYRLTIPPIGADTTQNKIKIDSIVLQLPGDTSKTARRIGYAHGLLYAFHSLYVMVNDEGDTTESKPSGLYRLQDTNGDDQYDKITLLKRLEGDGEHGPHSIVLAPDGKSLYICAGNFTKIPKMDNYSAPPVWQIDNLLPLLRDPNGHDGSVNIHGGWIAQIDSMGANFNLISSGFRNPFDFTFNEAGDIFTFDSDMEWDLGTPWYRPIRICHVTNGSEFGWRPGTDKWSPSYPDNLPPLLNIGQGSPTSVFSGMPSHFPEKYRRSVFAFDWSFGIIYSIHPQAEGAGYKATAEEFVSGSPLPLTDGMIGPDGALYFLTGGRRLESDLYRVYYQDNKQNTETLPTAELTDIQKLRRKLETYHTAPKPGAVDFAWNYLKSEDRFIRFAARIAIEHQPVNEWKDKAVKEKDPVALTQAAIALARQGGKEEKDNILKALTAVDFSKLTQPQQLDLLRAIELTLLRFDLPAAAVKSQVITYLNAQYPAKTNMLNRSLSKLLLFLDAPDAVEKTMALMASEKDDSDEQKPVTQSSDLIMRNLQYGMDIAGTLSNVPPQQQTYYAVALSAAKNGWTPELREKYFQWFYKAFGYKGGHSFIGFIDLARKNALKNVPQDKFAYFNTISGDSIVNRSKMGLAADAIQPKGPGKRWEVDTALALLTDGLNNRNFAIGKAMYSACLCSTCHTIRGDGGNIGPDLTQLGTRFSYKDMLESIVDPSKTISDQFAAKVFYLKDGTSVIGRLMNEDADKYYISQNPFAPQTLKEIAKKDVTRTRLSEISVMPPGLINRLNGEELKDLLAYLKSGGNPKDSVFSAKK
ncbi:MAG: c-type cytochrome [Chitinophagaceae bacterium]|jgi:putative heme-binding domain-containing protein|nr:c-type cytochrome [Chitinophagaceae bacterium]